MDIGIDQNKRVSKFLSDQPDLTPTSLLYPVETKNYNTDPFISDQWTKAVADLEDAYFVTIIGYSAPATDVEARALLLKAWRQNSTKTLAEFSILDIREPAEVEKSWSDSVDGRESRLRKGELK